MLVYEYKGGIYPDYLKRGNACQFVIPFAKHFCVGQGLDVGAGEWCLPWALAVDIKDGGDAMNLPLPPYSGYDFIFSSHCLEHLENPVAALEHWRSKLRHNGILFLYLPHPDMEYWLPQNNRKHLHSWMPKQMQQLVYDVGFVPVIASERDLAWSFAVVGVKA